MSTYRTDGHWGVTIVREGPAYPRWVGTEPQETGETVETLALVPRQERV